MNKIYLHKFPKNIAVIAVIIMGVVFGGMISANAQSLPVQGIDAVRCGAGELTLTVSWSGETLNPDNVKWYTVPFYGTPIATGMSYTTPYLEYTQAFYVDYTGEGGCSQCTRLLIRAVINDQVIDPQISYSSLKICNNLDQNFIPTIVGASGGTYEVTPGTGLTVNSTTGIFNPENATQGNYTITFNPEEVEGCNSNPVSTTVTITQALETPVISYPLQSYCSSDGLVSVTKTAGADGGTYSAYPSGLAIDAATGQINPAGSATGNYTISYTVPGTGGCAPVVGTTTVSVLKLPTAQISYTSASYTQNQGEQAIQITGTDDYLGGIFSAPEGLTINSSTGTITPSTSTAGGYTVTYTKTAVSPCSDNLVATTFVTIYSQPVAQIVADVNEMCQAGTEPVVTFTGAGGTAPYTFRYKINGGGEQTITSASGQNSVTLNHPTLVAGTFTYEVFSVSDFNSSTRTYSEGLEPGVAIQITAPQVAAFEYSGSPYCSNDANPEPVFLNGGIAGTFSANSGGLVFATGDGVNPGTIDLIASTPGTYIVTNTIAATGGCSVITATASVTITALPLAGFSYPVTTYCQNDGTPPTPTFAEGAVAGTFTSVPAGVRFDNTTPGMIDLANSTPGTYQIVNTISASGGCADVVATVNNFQIIATPVAPAIAYSGSPYCNTITEAQPVELTGSTGGTFMYTRTSEGEGTLSINSETGAIIPSTSIPGIYHITYTVGVGTCTTIAETNVTIYESPVVTNNSTYAICSGENTNITLTASIPSSFRWTLGEVSSNILDASAGSGGSISQVLSNISYTESGTVEYVVIPTSTADPNLCEGNPFTITVTVGPNPQLVVNEPAAVCYTSTVDLTASEVTTGSTAGLTLSYWTNFETTSQLSTPDAVATTGTYYIKGTTASGCYTVREVNVTVNPLPTAPAPIDVTVTYDGSEHIGSATPPEGATVVWYDAETGGNVTEAPRGTNAGTYTAWAESVIDATGCKSAARTEVTVQINAAQLTVTATNNTKTYGTALVDGSSTEFTTSPLQNSETLGEGASVTLTFGTGKAADANVNTYTGSVVPTALTLGASPTAILSNYQISYSNGDIVVDAAPLTVTATNNTKTYGTALVDGSSTEFTTSPLQNSETLGEGASVTLTFGTGKAADANVSTYTGSVVPTDLTLGTSPTATLSNYSITYQPGDIIVEAAALTVTADDQSKIADGSVFSGFTSQIDGYVNGEGIGVVTGLPVTYTGAATTATTPGVYNDITPVVSGLSATNYSFTPINGTLTIYPVAPTASSPQTFCSGATVAELVASGDEGATFKWYIASTEGSALPTTDVLSASNTYYASQTVNGVESTLRSAGISVTLNTAPTPTFTAQPGANAYIGFEVTYTTESGKSDYVWAYPGQTVTTDYTIVSGGTSTDNTVTLIWNTSGSKTVTVNYTDGGCSAASPTSSTETTVAALSVGDAYGGGIVAYILQSGDPGYVDGETHGLIAAASDNAVSYWGCDNITVTGADDDALGAGTQNTIYIVSKYEGCDFAAKLCSDLVIGVYDDWYLPSKDELYKLYLNRTIIGGFSNALYWSSTEPLDDAYNAYTYNFDTGAYPTKAKHDVANLSRAIRSF